MLFYLDNPASMGPNSVAGINRTRGLNENLAREILELHTLGVRTGYTQDDVISFANVLTGWTFCRPATIPSMAASSCSIRACTSPAPQKVMGKVYAGRRGGAGPRRAARSGRASRDRDACRHQAGALLHCRRRRPLRWSSGWRRPSAIPPAISRRSPRRWSRPRVLDSAAPPSSSGRASGSSRMVRATGLRRPILRDSRDGQALLGEPLVAPAFAQGLSRRRGDLDRRDGAAAGRRQQLRGARRGQRRSRRT